MSEGWIELAEATFRMGNGRGDGYPDDGETPVRNVTVGPFTVAATVVTNAEYAAFVDATGWTTDAERYGWSFVFGGLLPDEFPDTRGVSMAPWWRQVHEADAGIAVPQVDDAFGSIVTGAVVNEDDFKTLALTCEDFYEGVIERDDVGRFVVGRDDDRYQVGAGHSHIALNSLLTIEAL